jgi:hypothetical protein
MVAFSFLSQNCQLRAVDIQLDWLDVRLLLISTFNMWIEKSTGIGIFTKHFVYFNQEIYILIRERTRYALRLFERCYCHLSSVADPDDF